MQLLQVAQQPFGSISVTQRVPVEGQPILHCLVILLTANYLSQ